MTEHQAIAQATEKYRDEGYTVTPNPDPGSLPAELRNRRPALLATKNGTSVVVEVWSRDRLNDLTNILTTRVAIRCRDTPICHVRFSRPRPCTNSGVHWPIVDGT